MPRATRKDMSVQHEDDVATILGGYRESRSGADPHRPGDVYIAGGFHRKLLIECKCTEGDSIRFTRTVWEKIEDEAATRGASPAVCLRLRDPHDPRRTRDLIVVDLNDFDEWFGV